MLHLLDFRHQKAVDAMIGAAPASTRTNLNDIWNAAMSANIPWLKLFTAFGIMAAGGFSPAAIAAGITSLFGTSVPPTLSHLTALQGTLSTLPPAA